MLLFVPQPLFGDFPAAGVQRDAFIAFCQRVAKTRDFRREIVARRRRLTASRRGWHGDPLQLADRRVAQRGHLMQTPLLTLNLVPEHGVLFVQRDEPADIGAVRRPHQMRQHMDVAESQVTQFRAWSMDASSPPSTRAARRPS